MHTTKLLVPTHSVSRSCTTTTTSTRSNFKKRILSLHICRVVGNTTMKNAAWSFIYVHFYFSILMFFMLFYVMLFYVIVCDCILVTFMLWLELLFLWVTTMRRHQPIIPCGAVGCASVRCVVISFVCLMPCWLIDRSIVFVFRGRWMDGRANPMPGPSRPRRRSVP